MNNRPAKEYRAGNLTPAGAEASSNNAAMLYEDHVVDAVRDHLKALGRTIESVAYAHQHGDDIVASSGQRTLRIEAKGEGSSKAGTNRFNKPFTLGQCKVSASKATFRALGVVSAGDEGAVAFPIRPTTDG